MIRLITESPIMNICMPLKEFQVGFSGTTSVQTPPTVLSQIASKTTNTTVPIKS